MDKLLFNFLKSLEYDEEDIENLCMISPELEYVSGERAIECAKAVVDAGFPKEDIGGLIFSNPGFLANDPHSLQNTLKKIDGNIEERLKEDPFLI